MDIVSIRLKNFLSFRELYHEFKKGAVLIQGRNLTDDSKETNGAGKSTIEAGIAYALMAAPLRKQTLDRDLIFWGEEEAEIELAIHCPIRKQTLRIYRVLKIKGSATLELFINEEPVVVPTVLEGNKYILNWIAITPEDLKSFYILNKENYKSFLAASNTDKLALINRFMKVDALEQADDVVKEQSQPYKDARDKAERELYQIQGELKAHKDNLEAEQERDFEQEREDRIASIEEKIERYKANANSYRKTIAEYEELKKETAVEMKPITAEIKKITAQVEQLQNDKSLEQQVAQIKQERQETDQALKEARDLLNENEEEKKNVDSSLSELQTLLAGSVTCPKCSHRFLVSGECEVVDVEASIQEFTEAKGLLEEAIAEIDAVISECRAAASAYDEQNSALSEKIRIRDGNFSAIRRGLSSKERELNRLEIQVAGYNSNITQFNAKVTNCEELITEQEALLQQVKTATFESKVEELQGIVTLTEKKVAKAQKKFEEAEAALNELQQWGQRFKDFRMLLACEQLRVIQDAANTSLQKQQSELRVSIDGFKVNAKGQVKSEITVLVINGQGEYKSFWSFSGGERARVEVAIIQAFQEMLNATNPYGGLNFLMIDEVLEGTDPLGLSLLLEALNGVNYPVYIISHVMNIRAGVTTLTVTKENGESSIKDE